MTRLVRYNYKHTSQTNLFTYLDPIESEMFLALEAALPRLHLLWAPLKPWLI